LNTSTEFGSETVELVYMYHEAFPVNVRTNKLV
jgi:hypothetical protein